MKQEFRADPVERRELPSLGKDEGASSCGARPIPGVWQNKVETITNVEK